MNHMKGYIIFLCISVPLVIGLNCIWLPVNVTYLEVILRGVVNFAAIFGLDIIIACVLHGLPRKAFNPYKKVFLVSEKERKFLDGIKVAKWKDKIPETGKVTAKFAKDKIQETTPEYLYYFLEETCAAEIVHIGMALIGALVIPANPVVWILRMTLPYFIINLVLNIPPILIQRFNRPKLLRIYELSLKKRQKEQAVDNNE